MKKPSLLIIFLTVFIDLIGFGIVLPLLPRYSQKLGAEGFAIGAIIASFSVMQFFFSPVWGRLSDRIGRRPVLLLSNAGSALSYVMFALSASSTLAPGTALLVLLGSRVFAGACGANISVASAYIADVTAPENRSKGMALIGVSFGLGFILGPALGALSAYWFGLAGPGWVAATLCASNFIFAWFVLVESRQPNSEPTAKRPKLAQWAHTLRQPKVGLLVCLYFLATFCFACFESTLPLLMGSPAFHPDDFRKPRELADKLTHGTDTATVLLRAQLSPDCLSTLGNASASPSVLKSAFFSEFNRLLKMPSLFDAAALERIREKESPGAAVKSRAKEEKDFFVHLNRRILEDAYPDEIKAQTLYFDVRRVGYIFAYCGLVSTLIQGGVIGRLVKRFGEPKLIYGSLVVVAVSMLMIPYVSQLTGLLVALALFSAATGVNRAPTMGLISIHTPAGEQGATLGVTQSAGTLARIFGPVFATGLYGLFPHSPYVAGAAIAGLAAFLAWRGLCRPAGATTETSA